MILEVLVSSTPTDKTFFYKSKVSQKNSPCEGQIVKLKFRKKNSGWFNPESTRKN